MATSISDHPAPAVVGGNSQATKRATFKKSTVARAASRRGVNLDVSAKNSKKSPMGDAARKLNFDMGESKATEHTPDFVKRQPAQSPETRAKFRAAITRRQGKITTDSNASSAKSANMGAGRTAQNPGLGDKIRLLSAARNTPKSIV